jgi:hypothetical protein
MKGPDHLQHVGIDGRAVLKWDLKRQGMGAWRRFNLAVDWAQWQAVVNVIMSSRIFKDFSCLVNKLLPS